MPLKSPFFPRTSVLCESMNWKIWAGYHAVSSYLTLHDMEYFAIRNASGLLDVSPLFKYQVSGRDAAKFLSRIMVKNIAKMKVGRVSYCCWCTDNGKVVDDGTVMRREEDLFFVTSADPCFSWFSRFLRGYDVELKDVSDTVGGLALQGPKSRAILNEIMEIDPLKFFWTKKVKVDDFEIYVSRTGYTGDLGYELWVDHKYALNLWDALVTAGKKHALRPFGLDALDVSRVEAGLILKDVDYYNALYTLTDHRKSSPYEITLGWTVDLDREPFNGQNALRSEKQNGSAWCIVGLDINWEEIEALYAKYDLPPEIDTHAWRKSIPIYTDKRKSKQIGYATSGTWSPILKKNIALATLEKKYETYGSQVQIEYTVEHHRYTVSATIAKPQFFNPERKTSNPKLLSHA